MKYVFLAFSSLTYAYKGKDAVDAAGVSSRIIRLSKDMTRKGCRYGLEVKERDLYAAGSALDRAGIPYSLR